MSRIDCPTVSVALCPKICSAARFQEVIDPVRSCVITAPSDDSTVASRNAASSKDAEGISFATCYTGRQEAALECAALPSPSADWPEES
jgi:hypothetical protein